LNGGAGDAGRYVLTELVPLCQSRGLPRTESLTFAEDLLGNPHVELVWVDEDDAPRRAHASQDRLDKSYSLCDAVSFLIMRQYNTVEALTTDRHFEQEGFARLPGP